jgi:hypothetical protein
VNLVRKVTLLAGAGLLGVIAFAVSSLAQQPRPNVHVYPPPGTTTLTTSNQISFRGVPKDALGEIVVTGSRSGRHRGTLRAHSDGAGASFLSSRRFTPGEEVTVRTRLRVTGAREGDFSYKVARRPPPLRAKPAEPPTKGRGSVQRYETRKDLVPPAVVVTTRKPGRAPGHVFISPKSGRGQDGPMIIDDAGNLVWFKPTPGEVATDLRVQTYRGRPVLTWWQGRTVGGEGIGEGVIYDDRYQPVRRVRAANGHHADLHEFLLTPRGTAYLVIYDAIRRDLTPHGGVRDGVVSQAVVQEIDIETGLVLFEWHSLGDVALSETYKPVPRSSGQWDYMHINSVDETADGDLILSSRATRGVYRLDKETGKIVWRLGGKRSDFRLGRGASFAMQHDARVQPDGTLTLYDNSATPPVRKHSRAITLVLDPAKRTATLKQALVHPRGLLSATQGSAQRLPTGGMFVGFGSQRWFSEYDATGKLVFDGRLARGNDSYRAYRFQWRGRPITLPKAVARRSGSGVTAKVSWNGATDVANWQLLAGDSERSLAPVATVPKRGFETTLQAQTRARFVAVRGLDASGAVLGTSAAIRPEAG